MNYIQKLLPGDTLTVSVDTPSSQPLPESVTPNIKFGFNTCGADNWNASARMKMTVDCFPLSQWVDGKFDAAGWPIGNSSIRLFTVNDGKGEVPNITGVYKISFDGTCSLGASNGIIKNVVVTNNKTTADLEIKTSTDTDVYFNNVGAGIKNIKIIRPGYENSTQVFTNEFKKMCSAAKVIRCMNLLETNWDGKTDRTPFLINDKLEWASRPKPDRPLWATPVGIPIEHLVTMANETGCDLWFNINHKASDDYVKNLGQYFKDNLKTNVIIEFSNELWNNSRGFWQGGEVLKVAKTFSLGGQNDWYNTYRYVAKKLYDYRQILKPLLGDKVKFVMAGQAATPATVSDPIFYCMTTYGSLPFEAIACAPYFVPASAESGNPDQLYNDCISALDKRTNHLPIPGTAEFENKLALWYTMAQSNGVELWLYECGIDMGYTDINTDNKVKFAYDGRAQKIIAAYIRQLYASGCTLACYFQAVTAYNMFQWGASDTVDISRPKMLGIIEAVSDDPRLWKLGAVGTNFLKYPTPTVNDKQGLNLTCYSGGTWTTVAAKRIDPFIDFWWGNYATGGPYFRKDIDPTSAKATNMEWTGYYIPEHTGMVKLYCEVEGNDSLSAFTLGGKAVNLVSCVKGVKIPILIRYTPEFSGNGAGYIRLWQETPDGKTIVPKWQLTYL